MCIRGVWRLRNNTISDSVCGNQLALPTVPFSEDLCRGSAAQNPRMDQTGKADMWNVPRRAEDSFKVPDRLGSGTIISIYLQSEWWSLRFRIMFIQEASAIVAIEDARESPRLILEGLDVLDLDEQHIARHGGLDVEWTGQVVNLREVNRLDVVGRVVVFHLPAGPVKAFDLDHFVVCNFSTSRDCQYYQRCCSLFSDV